MRLAVRRSAGEWLGGGTQAILRRTRKLAGTGGYFRERTQSAVSVRVAGCRPLARRPFRRRRGGRAGGREGHSLVRSRHLARQEGTQGRRLGDDRRGEDRAARRQPAGAERPDDHGQACVRRRQGPRAHDRMDHAARRARDRHGGQAAHAQGDDHAHRYRQGRSHDGHGRSRDHDLRWHAQPAWRPPQRLDQARPDGQRWQQCDRSAERGRVAQSATRSSSRRRISIRARPSVATSRRSAATRSRSTRASSTCTSARSPSTWTSAAKSAC